MGPRSEMAGAFVCRICPPWTVCSLSLHVAKQRISYPKSGSSTLRILYRESCATDHSREKVFWAKGCADHSVRESPPLGVPQLHPSGGGGHKRHTAIMVLATAVTVSSIEHRFRALS